MEVSEGSRYAYYANGGVLIKNLNGNANPWWLRTSGGNMVGTFVVVNYSGGRGLHSANISEAGISFAFCF